MPVFNLLNFRFDIEYLFEIMNYIKNLYSKVQIFSFHPIKFRNFLFSAALANRSLKGKKEILHSCYTLLK